MGLAPLQQADQHARQQPRQPRQLTGRRAGIRSELGGNVGYGVAAQRVADFFAGARLIRAASIQDRMASPGLACWNLATSLPKHTPLSATAISRFITP